MVPAVRKIMSLAGKSMVGLMTEGLLSVPELKSEGLRDIPFESSLLEEMAANAMAPLSASIWTRAGRRFHSDKSLKKDNRLKVLN